jgi:Protein of unknown function (DUF3276)
VEFGKFRRGDRDDRNRDDRGRDDRGGERRGGFDRDRPRYGDRDNNRGGGFDRDRPRYGDRDNNRGGGFDRDRPRYGDRDNNRGGGGGFERSRGGGGGDRDFDRDEESVFSKKVRAGKRRTYFFDVKKTRGEDYFITITESTRREDGYGYKRHKLFLYKEDFNRLVTSLNEVVDHVKTDLMPEFDYEEFDRRQAEWEAQNRDQDDEFGSDDRDADAPKAEREEAGADEEQDKNEDDDLPPSKRGKDDDEVSW